MNDNNFSFDDLNWRENKTILSGDIGTADDDSDNVRSVVTAKEVSNAKLWGFHITGGNALGAGNQGFGGGVRVENAKILLENLVVHENKALGINNKDGKGGGVYIKSDLEARKGTVLFNVVVHNNNQIETPDLGRTDYGGGIYIEGVQAVALINVVVYENEASKGGGIAISGRGHRILHATVYNNTANSRASGGTATGQGGGIFIAGTRKADILVVNSIVEGNSSNGTQCRVVKITLTRSTMTSQTRGILSSSTAPSGLVMEQTRAFPSVAPCSTSQGEAQV